MRLSRKETFEWYDRRYFLLINKGNERLRLYYDCEKTNKRGKSNE